MLRCVKCGEDLKNVKKEVALNSRYSVIKCEKCSLYMLLDKITLKIEDVRNDESIRTIAKDLGSIDEAKRFVVKAMGDDYDKEVMRVMKAGIIGALINVINKADKEEATVSSRKNRKSETPKEESSAASEASNETGHIITTDKVQKLIEDSMSNNGFIITYVEDGESHMVIIKTEEELKDTICKMDNDKVCNVKISQLIDRKVEIKIEKKIIVR